MARDTKSLLKGQHTKFYLQPLTRAPEEGQQSILEPHEKSLELVALGRELKGQLPGSLCSVIPHTAEAIFFEQRTPLRVATAWEEAIAPPAGIPPCRT